MKELGAVAGAVIGFYLGGPAGAFQGAVIGYDIGSALGPKQHILGPKLADLKAPSADYGAPISYIIGDPRLAGNIIWASDKRPIETDTEVGKGGPGVVNGTFTYEQDVYVVLSINPCDAIRRVFSNGKLIWSAADGSDIQSQIDSGGFFYDVTGKELSAGANTAWREIRFYGGGPDQLPDPTYEAAVGVGNAPANRGRAAVMLVGLNLGQSGQDPLITFEVVRNATVAYGTPELRTSVPAGSHTNQATPHFDLAGYLLPAGQWSTAVVSPEVRWYSVANDGTPTYLTSTFAPDFGELFQGTADESCYACINEFDGDSVICTRLVKQPVTDSEPAGYAPLTTTYFTGFGTGGAGFSYNAATFARGEGFFVLGNTGTSQFDKKLRIYGVDSAILLGESPDLGAYLSSICIRDGYAYAVPPGGGSVFQVDLTTFALTATITAPTTVTAMLCIGDDGNVYLFDESAVYVLTGSLTWDTVSSSPGQIGSETGTAGVVGGVLLMEGGASGAGAGQVYAMAQSIAIGGEALSDVVTELCERTGQLTSSDVDVSELTGDVVHAFAISQVSTTRSAIETLMSASLFEGSEGNLLRFPKRGGAPVMTIAYADLGASADGAAEPLPIKRLNDMEIPARVTVTFANILNDFQNGTQSGERLVTESTAESAVEIPLGLTPTEAKQLADINTMDLAVSQIQVGPLALPRKYAALEPSDVVLVEAADGSTFRCRITKVTYGGGTVQLELVQDDATVITSSGAADDADNSTVLVRAVSQSQERLLDIPILRDADNDAGFYDQVKPTGDKWSGAAIYSSADDVTYAREATVTGQAVFGQCTTTLGDHTGRRVFDWKNSVTVNVGAALSSSTRAAILNDQSTNACAIGVHGRWELLQFINATFVSDGVYTLTGLLRGGRGTEQYMTGHAAGDLFSLLQSSGMVRVPVATTLVGLTRYYKPVSIGKSVASASEDAFAEMGVGMKPFSPVRATVVRDVATGDITFGWLRRTRLATRMTGPLGVSVPLGEVSEAYSIDVFTDNTYATVKRTIAAATNSAPYTSAQQTTDFGSNQATVYFKVYQLSAVVGRGYELKAAA